MIIVNIFYCCGRGFGAIIGTYLNETIQSQYIFALISLIFLFIDNIYFNLPGIYKNMVPYNERKPTYGLCDAFFNFV